MVDSLAVELRIRGHDVTIAGIGSEPHVPDWPHSIFQRGLKTSSLPLRALNEALASIRLFFRLNAAIRRGQARPPDSCIVFQPSIFLSLTNFLFRLVYRSRTYLVQRDILPDWMLESGQLKPGFASVCLRAFKHLSLAHADAIGVECDENYEYIPSRYKNKLRTLPNWRNYDAAVIYSKPLPQDFRMIYGGRIGKVQGFDVFLNGCAGANVSAQLDIYCDERGLQELNAPMTAPALQATGMQIHLHSMLTEPDFVKRAADYSLGIVTLSSAMRTHNIPGKLLGYLAAGIPVLAVGPKRAALRRVVDTLRIGLYAEADEASQIAVQLSQLAANRELLNLLRANVLAQRNTFDVRRIAEALLLDIC